MSNKPPGNPRTRKYWRSQPPLDTATYLAGIEEYLAAGKAAEDALADPTHPWHRRYTWLVSKARQRATPGLTQEEYKRHKRNRCVDLLKILRQKAVAAFAVHRGDAPPDPNPGQ